MLNHLELTNFRNWSKLSLDLKERMILYGANGTGKTNVLEAIYLLSVTRSWRTKSDRNLVKWDEEVCRVVGSDDDNLTQIEIAIVREPYQKRIKVDGLDRKATETIGKIATVLFEPRSINLVFGPPAGRRRFLDVLLAQVNQEYAKSLVEFQVVLRQRNSLLRKISYEEGKAAEIKFWNDELIRLAEVVWNSRSDFFIVCQGIFVQSYQEISQSNEVNIIYRPAIARDQDYRQILEERWLSDLDQGTTTLGPHRDDFDFILNNRNAAEVASQGEARTLILALKKSEINYLSNNMGKDPILLLDDIFSELDFSRRSRIESIIGNHQVIITTTDLEYLDPNFQKSFTAVDVSKLLLAR